MARKGTKVAMQVQQDLFDYAQLSQENSKALRLITDTIVTRWTDAYMAVIETGEKLLDAKAMLDHGQFTDWLAVEITPKIKISYDQANGAMNLAKEYRRVKNTEHEDAFKKIASSELAAAYRLSQGTDDTLKNAVYSLVDEEPPSRREIEQAKRLYKQDKLSQLSITDEAKAYLVQTPIPEDSYELKRIQKLSKTNQLLVAKAIASGSAANVKEAIDQIKDKTEDAIEVEAEVVAEFSNEEFLTTCKGKPLTALRKLEPESINIAIVEGPLKFDWVDQGYPELLKALHPALKPGGFGIILMGHKAICATYDVTEAHDLHVLQPFVIRLQPGRTSTIVGINIMTASRLALVVYKSPFRQPNQMVVDLQTVGGENDLQDSVESGVEAGFAKFIDGLAHEDDAIAHVQLDPSKNFNMREFLVNHTRPYASKFYAVG